MSERYTRLLTLPENLYTSGAPVIIAAGALLHDTQRGNVLVQLKFRNISEKQIRAVKVSVSAFDVSGKSLAGVAEYQYLDFSAGRDDEFGQKQAIPLPSSITRNVAVKCTSVIFSDGTVWSAEEEAKWESFPHQKKLADVLGGLLLQYQRETSDKSVYEPLSYRDLWRCACGAINQMVEEKCHSCGYSEFELFALLDRNLLQSNNDEYQRKITEEKNRKAAAEKAARKKANKVLMLVAAAISLCLLVFAGVQWLVLPIMQKEDIPISVDENVTESHAPELDLFEVEKTIEETKPKTEHEILQELQAKHRTTISTGRDHTLALKEDGTVVAFGNNSDGQCNVEDWTDIVSVYAERTHGFSFGIKEDGTVVYAGRDAEREGVSELTDVTAVAYPFVLKTDGTLSRISNYYWQFMNTDDPMEWNDIVAVSSGNGFIVGLTMDGKVRLAKNNEMSIPDISHWENIVSISAGYFHVVAADNNGTVFAAGANDFGQCDVSGWKGIVAVAAGYKHTVGLKADGTVVATGYNAYGQCDVESWNDIVAISTQYDNTIGLKADGTLVATGWNSEGESDVAGVSNIRVPSSVIQEYIPQKAMEPGGDDDQSVLYNESGKRRDVADFVNEYGYETAILHYGYDEKFVFYKKMENSQTGSYMLYVEDSDNYTMLSPIKNGKVADEDDIFDQIALMSAIPMNTTEQMQEFAFFAGSMMHLIDPTIGDISECVGILSKMADEIKADTPAVKIINGIEYRYGYSTYSSNQIMVFFTVIL